MEASGRPDLGFVVEKEGLERVVLFSMCIYLIY